MKIVADRAIPFLRGVFEPYSEVVYRDGTEICAEDVNDADAVMTRTRTRCGAPLLEASSVRIIASATIGTDHIDKAWCASRGILVENAAGCNAGGVAQYVFTALYGAASRKAVSLAGATIGIVGVGNVGRRIEDATLKLGFRVLRNDPPREAEEGGGAFCSLDTLLEESDVVTLHVPLDASTRGMADRAFFSKMKRGAFFINASRGEVVDEKALKEARGRLGAIVIDTWNNEPDIDRDLVGMADIATPHIAGYSLQGKRNGTAAAVRAVARCFGIRDLYGFYPGTEGAGIVSLDLKGLGQEEIAARLQSCYPVFADDLAFRMRPGDFEKLRMEYGYRNEFRIE